MFISVTMLVILIEQCMHHVSGTHCPQFLDNLSLVLGIRICCLALSQQAHALRGPEVRAVVAALTLPQLQLHMLETCFGSILQLPRAI